MGSYPEKAAISGLFLFSCLTMRWIYQAIFKVLKWKVIGDVPRDLRKYIIIVAPHSSNWDFPVGLAVRSIMRFPSNFLGKEELFRPPFGWLFYKLGGHPVNRKQSENLVDQVAAIFKSKEEFVLAIAPEGTRKQVSKWKTGFYYIALKAEIPIVMAGIDYPSRSVTFSPPFYPTGDFNKDAESMMMFFRQFKGKNRPVTEII
jgi:1-acyl-sn-glycerol-3-phosphate acyltransferase